LKSILRKIFHNKKTYICRPKTNSSLVPIKEKIIEEQKSNADCK